MKLFRGMRRQRLFKNGTTNYLAYAIGEIFLVVIGILIALQVNNFNEQRRANVREKNYLLSMDSELSDNLEIVQTEIKSLDKSIDSQRQLIALINSSKDTIQETELSRILAVSFSQVYKLKYQDGTFKELLYSGGLEFISNESIKNEVASWEGRMTAVRKQEEGVYDAREKIIHYMIDKKVFKVMLDDVGISDYFQVQKSNKRNTSSKMLLTSPVFENLLSYHIALNISQKSYYENLEGEIDNLLQMVKEELKKQYK